MLRWWRSGKSPVLCLLNYDSRKLRFWCRLPTFTTTATMAAASGRFESERTIEERKEQSRTARAEVLRQVPPLWGFRSRLESRADGSWEVGLWLPPSSPLWVRVSLRDAQTLPAFSRLLPCVGSLQCSFRFWEDLFLSRGHLFLIPSLIISIASLRGRRPSEGPHHSWLRRRVSQPPPSPLLSLERRFPFSEPHVRHVATDGLCDALVLLLVPAAGLL